MPNNTPHIAPSFVNDLNKLNGASFNGSFDRDYLCSSLGQHVACSEIRLAVLDYQMALLESDGTRALADLDSKNALKYPDKNLSEMLERQHSLRAEIAEHIRAHLPAQDSDLSKLRKSLGNLASKLSEEANSVLGWRTFEIMHDSLKEDKESFNRQRQAFEDLAHKLALANIGMGLAIVKKTLPLSYRINSSDELVGDTYNGLFRACCRFRVEMGNRLSTYAYRTIKTEITEALYDDSRLICISPATIRNLSAVRQEFKELADKGAPLSPKEVKLMKKAERKIDQIERATKVSRLFHSTDQYGEDSGDSLIDEDTLEPVESAIINEERQIARDMLEQLKKNHELEADVVEMHLGVNGYEPHTFQEIGEIAGITRAGARTVYLRAIKRLSVLMGPHNHER